MAGDIQPLSDKFAIVGADGLPTLYFIQWAQQRQIDIQESTTIEQVNEALVTYLAAHPLQEGSGIQITPSGNLTDSPTITAAVQEILDQVTPRGARSFIAVRSDGRGSGRERPDGFSKPTVPALILHGPWAEATPMKWRKMRSGQFSSTARTLI
jgi:hypothetical protein